jgi:hypothetical protein
MKGAGNFRREPTALELKDSTQQEPMPSSVATRHTFCAACAMSIVLRNRAGDGSPLGMPAWAVQKRIIAAGSPSMPGEKATSLSTRDGCRTIATFHGYALLALGAQFAASTRRRRLSSLMGLSANSLQLLLSLTTSSTVIQTSSAHSTAEHKPQASTYRRSRRESYLRV